MKNTKVQAIGLAVLLVLGAGVPAQAAVMGPTGNFYDVVWAQEITWDAANAVASAMTYNGLLGHLATISSAGENDFVASILPPAGSGVWVNEYWLGGFQNPITQDVPTAGWTWVNGEGTFPGVNGQAVYANWAQGEPNDWETPEQYLAMGGPSGYPSLGQWNDVGGFWIPNNINGYVVEYQSVPDGGATLTLLGGALGVLGFLNRRSRN